MITTPRRSASQTAKAAIALSLGLALAGCGGMPTNRSLESFHQPVVERTNYTLDVDTGSGGLAYTEQRRVAGWFEAMGLKYGDKVTIDDPLTSPATRSAVEALAGRYGILVGDTAPVTVGHVNAGTARIVVTRAKANVPGCPDWSKKSDANYWNATSSNYGCAVNGNMAAMVADPEHLIKGAEGGSDTVIMSSNKAIKTYRSGGNATVSSVSSTGK